MDEEVKKQQEKEAAEKLEAEKKAAVDAATADLKKQLEEKENELKGLKDKDFNFGKVNTQKEELEKTVEDLKKRVDEAEKKPIEYAKNNALDAFAGSNKELREKIEFHFGRVGKEAKSPQEVDQAMKEAYLLATGRAVPVDAARRAANAGPGYNRPAPVNTDQVDPEVKEWATQMNNFLPKNLQISDEDLKNPKYKVKPGQSAESHKPF